MHPLLGALRGALAARQSTLAGALWAAIMLAALGCVACLLAPRPLLLPTHANTAARLDRGAFFAHARHLDAASQKLASAYVGLIDDLTRAPMDARARAQFASDALGERFQYAEDSDVWGAEDYWASPLEFVSKRRGDCEDFAIAAYYMLYASGWPKARMRLAYATLALDGRPTPHMVLLVDTGAGYVAIDNTHPRVEPLANRPDLAILFSFNDETVYQGATNMSVGSASTRISKWRSVMAKALDDGFH